MMFKKSVLLVVAVVVCLSGTAQAQIDPFLRLDFGVKPDCPFDCDSVFLVVEGELPSTFWEVPEVLGWTRVGSQIAVEMQVGINPNGTLPVTVPFTIAIPIGTLSEGAYEVTYTIWVDNPIATMPVIPVVVGGQHFRVAPPGDQDCDGRVNVLDVVRLVQPIFRGFVPPDENAFRRADVDCNGTLNVFDLVHLVYYVFRGGEICDPCDGVTPAPYVRITHLPLDSLWGDRSILEDVSIVGDTMTIVLSHSGGCLVHEYYLFAPPDFAESFPVQTWVYPQHIDPGDPCDAWVTETLSFNLRPLADLYFLYYGRYDPILLNVIAFEGGTFRTVTYTPE